MAKKKRTPVVRKKKSKQCHIHAGGWSEHGAPVFIKLNNEKVNIVAPIGDYYFLEGLPSIPNESFKNYLDYCRSDYFKRLKAEVLRLANGKCKKCKKKANTAHHLKYRPYWSDTKLKDCIAICHKCHNKIHRKAKKNRQKRLMNKLIAPIVRYEYEDFYAGI